MGLIRAGMGALGGTLADQWKEFFYCDSMGKDVLVTKGQKRTSGRSSNTKGNDNIISNGSGIAVADGQCMLIVEQGKVVEVCAEPGEFTYDSSTEPSIFSGNLGDSVKQTFQVVGKRFTYGGDTGKDQRVYYINTKEIPGNKYGTANPIPFRVVDERAGIDMDIGIKCFGLYSFRITNPVLFYTNVCSNVTSEYHTDQITEQMKGELLNALQPALARVGDTGVRYSGLPAHTKEISEALNDELSAEWKELRGIEIKSFSIASLTANEEDEKTIKEMQREAAYTDPGRAAGAVTRAQAKAMEAAASNPNAGPAMAFMGMGLAGQAGGVNAQSLFEMAGKNNAAAAGAAPAAAAAAAAPSAQAWKCSCGTENTGKFCTNCGQPKPQPAAGWTCSCGTVNTGNFCTNCGQPKPAEGFICAKCGFKVEGTSEPPKFCPQCGNPF